MFKLFDDHLGAFNPSYNLSVGNSGFQVLNRLDLADLKVIGVCGRWEGALSSLPRTLKIQYL